MDLEKINKIKAQMLKKFLQGHKADEKGSRNSVVYPVTNHGPNMPPTLKTHSSIPASNCPEGLEAGDDEPEEGEPEVDGPGTSKTTSSSLRVSPGESTMVPPAHAHTAFGVVEQKHRTSPFVQRCVAAITGGKPSDRNDLSGAFAKCVATEQKSGKKLSKNAKRRAGYPDAKSKFVSAINAFKSKRRPETTND